MPSEFPVAPTVGIVPGATVGDMVGIMVDDRAGVPGVRGVLADLVWASTVPQPNRATANRVRRNRCIQASCAATFRYRCLVPAGGWVHRTVRSPTIDPCLISH
jgi:hypothetical protein